MKEGSDPSVLLKKDGNYALKVHKAEPKVDKKGAEYLALQFVVTDSDVDPGSTIYSNLFIEGVFESGSREGHKKIEVLLDLLLSGGKTEIVSSFLQEGALDLQEAAKVVVGSTIYARVVQREGLDSVMRSEPIFYIKPEKYAETKSSGVGFRSTPDPMRGKGGKSVGLPQNSIGGGQPVMTDQLATDV